MLRQYNKVIDEYAAQGMLNSDAYREAFSIRPSETRPMTTAEEFTLDVCAYYNRSVGAAISLCHGCFKGLTTAPDEVGEGMKNAVNQVVMSWEAKGWEPTPNNEFLMHVTLTSLAKYLTACCAARTRALFRKQSYRDMLYKVMSDMGMSRAESREWYYDVVALIEPQYGDWFSPDYLRDLVVIAQRDKRKE